MTAAVTHETFDCQRERPRFSMKCTAPVACLLWFVMLTDVALFAGGCADDDSGNDNGKVDTVRVDAVATGVPDATDAAPMVTFDVLGESATIDTQGFDAASASADDARFDEATDLGVEPICARICTAELAIGCSGNRPMNECVVTCELMLGGPCGGPAMAFQKCLLNSPAPWTCSKRGQAEPKAGVCSAEQAGFLLCPLMLPT